MKIIPIRQHELIPPLKGGRLEGLDFLKCVMILLMITFHLVYIEGLYPTVKTAVYTFHMPVFLVISGFLMNLNKNPRTFYGRTILWLLVPYLWIEGAYIVGAAVLPIHEHIDGLTAAVFLDRLLLHPLGPYWYLQLMVICGSCYYAVCWATDRLLEQCTPLPRPLCNPNVRLSVKMLILFGLYYLFGALGIVSFPCALYFLLGVLLRNEGGERAFTQLFIPRRPLLFIAIALLLVPEFRDKASFGGILVVVAMTGGLMGVFAKMKDGKVRQTACFLGRNSLLLYIFSPVFTILCKVLIPLFRFDPTGILYWIICLTVCVCGCLAVGWFLERTRLSVVLFGKRQIISV